MLHTAFGRYLLEAERHGECEDASTEHRRNRSRHKPSADF